MSVLSGASPKETYLTNITNMRYGVYCAVLIETSPVSAGSAILTRHYKQGVPVLEKPRSWNEIRNASFNFVRQFQDETDGNAEAQSFWTEFLGMFGIDRKRVNAIFEDRAHRADTGGRGWIDMFWPGQIAVEHKSKGKDLAAATQQCLTYLHDKPDHDLSWCHRHPPSPSMMTPDGGDDD